jgi:hypothetical protein
MPTPEGSAITFVINVRGVNPDAVTVAVLPD